MSATDERLRRLGDRYLRSLFDFWPNQGSHAGLHEYDPRQPDLSIERIQTRRDELNAYRRELEAIAPEELSADEQFDYRLLQVALGSEQYQWEVEQAHILNPMWYLSALEITGFMTRSYAPLAERVEAAIGYLEHTPRVLEAARTNLRPSLPRPFVETALEAFTGMLSFYDYDLPRAVAPLDDAAIKERLEKARTVARQAVDDFVGQLRDRYLPAATPDFAIGPENYARMLQGEMVDLPLDAILEMGERDLARNLEGAREKARQIDPKLDPQEVAHMLRREHPTAAELLPAASGLLEEIRQYLIDHDVVSVPSEVRAQVVATPAFMRWTFASMDTPGPFEKIATEAYYYVTPPDPQWTPEQQDEWLSSFNPPVLAAVSIHEAYPGHYVHFLHVNHRTRDPLRQALLSYAFVEGWAHYTEEMMLDVGYGDHNPRLRLAQLEEALLRDCRYICSIRMHTRGMTVDEATRFFMENAFMEETPARKEAMRGTFDPGYLYYTLGKLMILKLREDYKTREGTNFNLKQFHDTLLAYGAPPVPLVREAMLGPNGGTIL